MLTLWCVGYVTLAPGVLLSPHPPPAAGGLSQRMALPSISIK
jgi:hypothetical protein